MTTIERSERATARCQDCGKVFRVPDPDRTYRCKACGGPVRSQEIPELPESTVPDGMVACPECEAVHPDGTPCCDRCGTTLDASPEAAGSERAAQLRREAQYVLKRATTTIERITMGYRLGALAYGIATVFAVLSLARADVPRTGGLVVVGLTSLLTVVLLMGSLHVRFHPFAWTVAVAALATAVTAAHAAGPNPFGVAVLGSAAWAAVAFYGLAPSRRFRRLIDQHRDLYVLHFTSTRARRALQGRTAAERHDRLMDALQSASRRAWLVSSALAAAVVLTSVAGSRLILAGARPAGLTAPALERFEAAWNRADMGAIDELFDPRVREVESARLAGLLAGHGWRDDPPDLGSGRSVPEGDRLTVEYELGPFTVAAAWVRVGTLWNLARVDMPAPSLDPTLAAFASAWRNRDPDAMAAFFEADVQAEMRKRIADAFENRRWRSTPAILDTELKDGGDGQVTAILTLEKGSVTTEWRFRTEGKWRLSLLRFPPR